MIGAPSIEVEARVAWWFRPALKLLLWSYDLVNRAVRVRVGRGVWEPLPLLWLGELRYCGGQPVQEGFEVDDGPSHEECSMN